MKKTFNLNLSLYIFIILILSSFLLSGCGGSDTPGEGSDTPVCAQVITHAYNPATGEEGDFPTPCDVPEGWVVGYAPQNYGDEGEHEVLTYTELEEGNSVVYYPSDIASMEKTPLIFFAPGWGSQDPTEYDSLLRFIASHGYSVIYANDIQTYSSQHFLNYFETMLKPVNDVLPYVDTTRIGVIGHSSGGGDAFSILRHFSNKGYGVNGRFLLAIAPWFAFDMTTAQMQSLPSNTNAVILQFEDDYSTDPRIPLSLYNLLTSIPDDQKDYQVYPDAGHGYPAGNRPFSEMQGVLKPLDALMKYVFEENVVAYDTALEAGNDDPYGSGLQEVKSISEYQYRCNSDANVNNVLEIDYCSVVP